MLPFVSADPRAPGGPAFTGVHGDGMVPGPTASKLRKKIYKLQAKIKVLL